ncbi:hypothetical protein ES703_107595 [subsurface metagenome]
MLEFANLFHGSHQLGVLGALPQDGVFLAGEAGDRQEPVAVYFRNDYLLVDAIKPPARRVVKSESRIKIAAGNIQVDATDIVPFPN